MIRFSAVVCTYNRCESLRDALNSLIDQQVNAEVDCEIIVVDNNSSDQTKQAVEQVTKTTKRSVRYLFECLRSACTALSYYVVGKRVDAVGAEINFWWRLGMFIELLSGERESFYANS